MHERLLDVVDHPGLGTTLNPISLSRKTSSLSKVFSIIEVLSKGTQLCKPEMTARQINL